MKSICFTLCLLLSAPAAWAGDISGTVTRANDDSPVVGAVVLVRGTDRFTVTTAGGAYLINNVPNGSYGLTCSGTGLKANHTGAVYIEPGASRDFSLGLPAPETDVSPAELVVNGHTLCASVPCGGVLIVARQNNSVVGRTVSRPDGQFRLAGPLPGACTFSAYAPFFQPSSREVVLETGGGPQVDLALGAAGPYQVSGHVYLSDNPVDKSGSTLRINGHDLHATTNEGGQFQLNGVPAGLVSISASRSGYAGQTETDLVLSGSRERNFVLHPPDTPGPPTYHLSGVVHLQPADGSEAAVCRGCRVSLFSQVGDFMRTDITDGEGAYDIGGAPAGTYLAGAALEGYEEQVSEAFELSADRSQNFTLQALSDYDWGPGPEVEPLGCTCSSAFWTPSALVAIGMALLLMRRRRKWT